MSKITILIVVDITYSDIRWSENVIVNGTKFYTMFIKI